MGLLGCLFRVLVLCGALALGVFAVHFWLTHKSYTFSAKDVAVIAAKHTVQTGGSADVKKLFADVYADLAKSYKGHILPEHQLEWVFMNAGGWMGSMCLLHASVTEYVLFFGTALDTMGHSGRYWANVSDTILAGEFHQWQEGELSYRVHKPGATVLHQWGEATAVHFKAGTWMVEYGRGFIPSTLGFALSDTLFSTQDFITLFYVLRAYTHALILEANTYVAHLMA